MENERSNSFSGSNIRVFKRVELLKYKGWKRDDDKNTAWYQSLRLPQVPKAPRIRRESHN
jgi:hypothetical protein